MKNLFPQDTRIAEILSAISILFVSLFLYLSIIDIEKYKFIIEQGIGFWLVIFSAFGSLQFFSISLYPKAELLRVIMSWVNGSLWIWISLQSQSDISDISIFFLGVCNLYAFFINSILLRKQWVN